MFRARQKYIMEPSTLCVEKTQKTLESGVIIDVMEDQSEQKLPDTELFNLEDQLKAGVMLEEVNSKIMKSKSVDMTKVVKASVVKTSEGEVKEIDG